MKVIKIKNKNHVYFDYQKLASKHPNVIFGGRLGRYAYLDMDDTVAAALLLAKKELSYK